MPDVTIRTDETARERAAALVPLVQATVPSADLAYVYTGAATVGLHRVCSVLPSRALTAADLGTQTGVDVQDTNITITDDDNTRAQAKATALGLSLAQVVGAAVVTGLALLSGVDPGPFTAAGTSRQFIKPFTP